MDDDDLDPSDISEEPVLPPRRHRASRLDPFDVLPPLDDDAGGTDRRARRSARPSVGPPPAAGRPTAGDKPRKRLSSSFTDPRRPGESRQNEFRA
ncbi:MAG: hypothetical protein ACRDYC_01445, partial [Acidimicrobiales bacterium]